MHFYTTKCIPQYKSSYFEYHWPFLLQILKMDVLHLYEWKHNFYCILHEARARSELMQKRWCAMFSEDRLLDTTNWTALPPRPIYWPLPPTNDNSAKGSGDTLVAACRHTF